eukprot:TRINITY_DN2142_c0_g1_i2.p1 TRINITY_DN2142_c0_g1~~TRINITY_DN2142_c0_g1_i2.p1  ORF type:complete len:1780 (+),score=399.42 TRINITY_DN2142_c0_g1_i2:65-5404(+)
MAASAAPEPGSCLCSCPASLVAPLAVVAALAGLLCVALAAVLWRFAAARADYEHRLSVLQHALDHAAAPGGGESGATLSPRPGMPKLPSGDSRAASPASGSLLDDSAGRSHGVAAAAVSPRSTPASRALAVSSAFAAAAHAAGGLLDKVLSAVTGPRAASIDSGTSRRLSRPSETPQPQSPVSPLPQMQMRRASSAGSGSDGMPGDHALDGPDLPDRQGLCCALCCRWAWTPAAEAAAARSRAARGVAKALAPLVEAHGGMLEAALGDEFTVSFGLTGPSVSTRSDPAAAAEQALHRAMSCASALLARGPPLGARIAGIGVALGPAEAGSIGGRCGGFFVGPAPEAASRLAAACAAVPAPALLRAPAAALAAADPPQPPAILRQFALAGGDEALWVLEPRIGGGDTVDPLFAEVWQGLCSGRGAEALAALQQHCYAEPEDAVAQSLLARLRYTSGPQVTTPRVVLSTQPDQGQQLQQEQVEGVLWRGVAYMAIQLRAAAVDIEAEDHRTLMQAFAEGVAAHGGELGDVSGCRLIARWLAPPSASASCSSHLAAASACAAAALRRLSRELGVPVAAGLGQGDGLCGEIHRVGVLHQVSMLSDAQQRAEALAGAAAADGFQLLAEGAFAAADQEAAWRPIAPHAEVAIVGPAEPVRLSMGIVELVSTPPEKEYARAVEEIRRWQWAKAAGLLQRLSEQQREEAAADDSVWVTRLLNAILRAEREERDGLRGAEEDLVAAAGSQGIRFRPCAAAGDSGSPGGFRIGRQQSGVRGFRGAARRTTAAGDEMSQSMRSMGSLGRLNSLRNVVSAQSAIKKSALKWRTMSGGAPQVSALDLTGRSFRQSATAEPQEGEDAGAGTCGTPRNCTTPRDTHANDRLRLVDLARQELAEAAGGAEADEATAVASAAESPDSHAGPPSPRNQSMVKFDNGSFVGFPAGSPRPRGGGLRIMRSRALVRACLDLHAQVPQSLLDSIEADAKSESAGHCWHMVAMWWNPLRLVALMYNCIVIPARSVYGGNPASAEGRWALLAADYLLDLVYWGDIVLNFREPIYIDGNRVTDKQIIAREYMRSWFAFDVLMCAPVELAVAIVLRSVDVLFDRPHLRFNRCLNILRLKDLVNTIHQDFFEDVHPVKMQLFVFIVCLFYILHWLGCMWGLVYVGALSEPGDAEIYWLTGQGDVFALSMGFYWAMQGFSGYSMQWPTHMRHVLVSLVCAVGGLGIFATVIAYMTTLLNLLQSSHQAHIDQIEKVVSFCDYCELDDDFFKDIMRYHRMLWAQTRQAFPDQWADLCAEEDCARDSSLQLPGDLAKEMCYFTNFRVVEYIPALRSGCDPNFIVRVVTHMRQHYGVPGEPLFTRGSYGTTVGENSGLWFLVQGSAEAMIGGRSIERLSVGGFWGEIVALGKAETQSADVILLEYSELYHMPREDFSDLVNHPEFDSAAANFRSAAERRQRAILEAARFSRSTAAPTPSTSPLPDPALPPAAADGILRPPPLLSVQTVGSFTSKGSIRLRPTLLPPPGCCGGAAGGGPGGGPPGLAPPPHPARLANAVSTGSRFSISAGLALNAFGSFRTVGESPQDDDLPKDAAIPSMRLPGERRTSVSSSSASGSLRNSRRVSLGRQDSDADFVQRQGTGDSALPRRPGGQRRVSIASSFSPTATSARLSSRSLNSPGGGRLSAGSLTMLRRGQGDGKGAGWQPGRESAPGPRTTSGWIFPEEGGAAVGGVLPLRGIPARGQLQPQVSGVLSDESDPGLSVSQHVAAQPRNATSKGASSDTGSNGPPAA